MPTKTELAEQAAEAIRAALLRLHTKDGLPLDCLLIGAHAQIVTMMTTAMGGPMTAQCCERAADRVRSVPSQAAVSLALAQPAGQA